MSERLIVGNWKMNGSLASVAALTRGIAEGLVAGGASVGAVICPPVIFLAEVAAALAEARDAKLVLGAQNLCQYEEGAYTGEVSGSMLRELGCRYVIVGHSERRQLFGESDQLVGDKFLAATKADLRPILCVGETEAERQQGKTEDVINRQLDAVIDRAGSSDMQEAVIAYEPVWAIGSGKVATAEQAQAVLATVRSRLGAIGRDITLLYGGSVVSENAEQLFAQPDIDGALVGGASLDAAQFVNICEIAG